MKPIEPTFTYFGATELGQVRDHNEDGFIMIDLSEEKSNPMGLLCMVADGMGGANAGEIASAIACKVIEERVLKLNKAPDDHRDIEKYLKNLILEAHQQIVKHADETPACKGMGTTAVIAWILGDHLHVVWCGDSRCYTYQKNQQYTLAPFTDDHSLVWQMVQNGELSAEEARVHPQSNIILQVLGSTDATPTPAYKSKKLVPGEKILLCSDGLNGMLSDEVMQQILEYEDDVEEVTKTLIGAANEAGGTDNITVLFVEVAFAGGSTSVPESPVRYKLTSRRILVLAFALLLAILVIILIVWNGNKSVEAENHDAVESTIAFQEVTESTHQDTKANKREMQQKKQRASMEVIEGKILENTQNTCTDERDFEAILIQLQM